MNTYNNAENEYYCGLDIMKFIMALLVVARHVIQIYYPADSVWRFIIFKWLSNLGVPGFFTIAGFLLFRKIEKEKDWQASVLRSNRLRSYVFRILKIYILWSIIYWPVDIYNRQPIGFYLHSLLMSSTIAPLWYLPALAAAVLIVALLYRTGAADWIVLIFTGALLCLGWIGDNSRVLAHAPQIMHSFLKAYMPVFITMRNGVFYGSFYVAVGAWMAGGHCRIPAKAAVFGSLIFIIVMYKEVRICSNINIVLSAAPAVICITSLALSVKKAKTGIFTFLREQSEWIYFTHYYFIYLLTWTVSYNPFPLTQTSIMLMIVIPMLVFTLLIYLLSHRKYGSWLYELI